MKSLIFAASLALLPVSAFAQVDLAADAIPSPDPMEQMKTFILDEGLEINLFASDPMIAKPVGMNFDAEGRLWVVSSRLYPHIKPGQRSDDQVVVLEDKDGDGAADKSTVFAENLLIPTGIMPGDGGVYVANSTEILFMKDTDGDLKEDERRTVLSGFGTEDTHHIIHAFRGGPDGMLYFNQSIYIHSHVETPHGIRRLLAGGIWHYRPETAELEVFARGFINTWGHAWDRYGQSFATDGAYGEGINYVFPGAAFRTAHNSKRNVRGLNPGQPKHCGLEIVSSSHFPQEWQGNMITNDFRGHRVNRFVVTESGSGYVSRQAADVVRTTHGAFRPIDVKIGPDGALYIADWYNPIIQHGEVDFRDERRDHTHGRIWRVTHKDRPLVKTPKLVGQPTEKLVGHLRSPEKFTRHFAKRQLRNRPKGEAIAAIEKARGEGGASPEDRLELMWAAQSINHLDKELLRELIVSKDHRIRAAAVRVLYHWHQRMADSPKMLARAATDDHPKVRLEAVNALRQIGTPQAIVAAVQPLTMPMDSNLDYAIWLTLRETESAWLPAYQSGDIKFPSDPKVTEFIINAVENPALLQPLVTLAKAGKANPGQLGLVGKLGGPNELAVLLDHAIAERDADKQCLTLLVSAARDRKLRPSGDLAKVQLLFDLKDEVQRSEAFRAAAHWKVPGLREKMTALIGDRTSASSVIRTAAIDALAVLGGKASVDTLAKASQSTDRKMSAHALLRLTGMNPDRAAAQAVAFMAKSGANADGVFRAFIGRKDGPQKLSAALEGKTIDASYARSGIRIAETSGGDNKLLIAALTKAAGLKPVTQAMDAEAMKAFVAEVGAGDPVRGEKIYRRKALLCQTCHAIGGAGGVIGPDMVSIGASAPVDYIVDSLLEPGKKIKEGYHTTVVTAKDGSISSGGLVRDSDGELVLRLVDGSFKTIATDTIAKREVSPVSLMPPGLTASLRRDELVDLVRFLSELGKEGDYKTSSERYVRRWRVLPYDDAVSGRIRTEGSNTLLTSGAKLPWTPAYSVVSGALPLAEIGINKGFNNDISIARFEIEVTAAGAIGLNIEDATGLQILRGDTMIEAKPRVQVELPTGTHDFIVLIDRRVRKEAPLKVSLFDVDGSAGRAQVVGGL